MRLSSSTKNLSVEGVQYEYSVSSLINMRTVLEYGLFRRMHTKNVATRGVISVTSPFGKFQTFSERKSSFLRILMLGRTVSFYPISASVKIYMNVLDTG